MTKLTSPISPRTTSTTPLCSSKNRTIPPLGGASVRRRYHGAACMYARSEERRVGKECGLGWRWEHSSRRRHTRLVSDWSSDVCSSDLSFVIPMIEWGSDKRYDDQAHEPD